MKNKRILLTALFAVLAVSCGNEKPSSIISVSTSSETISSSEAIKDSTLSLESSLSSNELISSENSSLSSEETNQELFISEYWNNNYDLNLNPNGNNNDKALELYNPSNESIDLSNYYINVYGNGQTTLKSNDYHIALSGTLAPKTCYVIVNKYASDTLKAYGDISNVSVYIGAKSSVGLYKNSELIDVFGEIGKSYSSNYDFVINGTEAATDVHNIIRKEGKRSSTTFMESDWEVHRDLDMSTLGIHEEDTIIKNLSATEVLNELVNTYYNYESTTFNGNITLYKEYKGYSFSYDFSCCSEYYNNDGTMIKEPDDNFYIAIYISVLNTNGNVIETNYYAGGTYKKA